MKSKKVMGPLITTVLIIGFTVALAVVIMNWGDLSNILFKPSFTATKDICWNETKEISYEYPSDFDVTPCPEFIPTTVKCYDYNQNEIFGLKCKDNSIICYKPNIDNFVDKSILVKKIKFNVVYILWYSANYFINESNQNIEPITPIKETVTETVCETNSVDEIEMCYFVTTQEIRCGTIKISDLSEDFLNSECKCIECEDICITCIKWKCEEYLVEVRK